MDVSPCLFDIQGKKLVGKTQQRIPYIVNTNMPVVQRNKHSELGEAGEEGDRFPRYVHPATKATAPVV